MNMNPEISILVPVYNVEPYLRRCIDSVLAQDFTDWEMVLVDDGSTDASGAICDEYAARDARMAALHSPNGGLPLAREAALRQARGEYVMFLDSDDWLLPHALSTLHAHITQGFDIVRGTNRRVRRDGSFTHEEGRFCEGVIEDREVFLEKVICADIQTYLWGALYRRDILRCEEFRQLANISVGEDWLANIMIARRVNCMKCIADEVCCYFINDASLMQTRICSNEYADRVKDILDETLKGESEHIRHLALCNRMAAYINNCFVPELPFDRERYKRALTFFSSKQNKESLSTMVAAKFLRFFDSPVLFRLHSRLYCLAFKYIRLKGKNRKVL